MKNYSTKQGTRDPPYKEGKGRKNTRKIKPKTTTSRTVT